MKVVCPMPSVWARIHRRLVDAWEQAGAEGEEPPMPLILAGWAYSNDAAKHDRWLDTIEWARRAGFASLIPELKPGERLEVRELSTYDIGPAYGPMYLRW